VNSGSPTHRVSARRIAIAIAVFVPLAFLLHRRAFALGWWADDPYILENVIFGSWTDFFWRPDVYQRLSMWNFTPMLAPSYGIDYTLFGLSPAWFYAHQITVIGLIASSLFLLTSRWGVAPGALAALLFVSSGPATICAQTLMTRHYLEGGLAALICVLLLVSTDRLDARSWLAGLAFFVAALSKEVYLPLVLVAPLLTPGNLRRGIRTSIPVFVALVIYVPLRLRMLAHTPGHWQFPWDKLFAPGWWLSGLDGAAGMLCATSGGTPWWLDTVLVVLAVSLAVVLVRRRRVWIALALALGTFGPMLPIWFDLAPDRLPVYRYTFHLAIVAAVGTAYLLRYAGKLPVRYAEGATLAAVVVVALATLGNTGDLSRENVRAQSRQTRQIDFLLTRPAGQVLVSPKPVNYWESIARIRHELRGEATPLVCSIPFDLRQQPARYFRYTEAGGRFSFADITKEFEAARTALLARRDDAEFSVDVEVSGGTVEITLDRNRPKTAYWLLRGGVPNVYEAYPSPPTTRAGGYRSPHDYFVRALKFTPDGKCVLSPEWRIQLDTDQDIHWSR